MNSTFFFMALGAYGFSALVNTLQYFVNKDKAYLFYALYLTISVVGLISFQIVITNGTPVSALRTIWSLTFLQRLLIISYLQFSIAFFSNEIQHEHIMKIWRKILGLVLVLFLIELLVFAFDGNQALLWTIQKYFNFTRIILTIFGIYHIRYMQSPLRPFYLTGTLLLWTGVLITLLFPLNLMRIDILHKNPYFYQTLAVLLEIVCFTIGLSYRSHLMLIQKQEQVNQERLEKEQIRNNIAADLHDDLGAGLSTIRLLGQQAQISLKKGENNSQFQKITQQASELIEKMSTIIWAMNSEKDTVDNLLQYIRYYAFEYLTETHKLNLQFPLPDLPPSLFQQNFDGETRREVFLTIKEAFHNIVKHADATAVQISIQLKDNSLEISISDNGKGLTEKNPWGNGLNNMAKRMAKIGGNFQILNNANNGIQVILTLPLTKVSRNSEKK
jgi:signal transduction histidine kinase